MDELFIESKPIREVIPQSKSILKLWEQEISAMSHAYVMIIKLFCDLFYTQDSPGATGWWLCQ